MKNYRLTNYLLILLMILALNSLLMGQEVLTLSKSIDYASENSPSIRESRLRLERSREMLKAQEASQKSQFSLSLNPVNYLKDREFNNLFSIYNTTETFQSSGIFSITQPIRWTDGTLALRDRFMWQSVKSEYNNSDSKTFNNNLYLSYTQPLFTYNRTEMEFRELELDLENTMLGYSMQLLSLEKDVASSFFTVFRQQMNLEISKEEYNNQKISYDIIKNKVDAGLAAMEELYQAELNLASSRSEYENQKVTLDNALDEFKLLLGISITEEITITADISDNPVVVELAGAIEYGISSRMEIRQREIDIENSQFEIIKTGSENEFKGDLTLSLGLIGTDEKLANMYNEPTENQQISLSLDIPIFDWGRQDALDKAAQSTWKISKLDLENEKNNIVLGVRKTYRSLLNLENQIEIAKQNEKNAKLTYEINLERYKNGDLTSLDLNMYQTQLSEKKLSLIDALINYKIELLNMKIQTLFDYENNTPVIPEFKKEK